MLEHLVSQYGYLAVLVGTFLEGETILILAGLASHRGYLDLPLVILCAFAGTLAGDQLYYYIGRSKGTQYLASKPSLQSRVAKVTGLLERHQTMMILGFRFLYGLRSVTPFVIGVSKITPGRFLLLNVIGAFIWSIVIGIGGYALGNALEAAIGDIKRYELWIFTALAATGMLVWLYYWMIKKPSLTRNPPEE